MTFEARLRGDAFSLFGISLLSQRSAIDALIRTSLRVEYPDHRKANRRPHPGAMGLSAAKAKFQDVQSRVKALTACDNSAVESYSEV